MVLLMGSFDQLVNGPASVSPAHFTDKKDNICFVFGPFNPTHKRSWPNKPEEIIIQILPKFVLKADSFSLQTKKFRQIDVYSSDLFEFPRAWCQPCGRSSRSHDNCKNIKQLFYKNTTVTKIWTEKTTLEVFNWTFTGDYGF